MALTLRPLLCGAALAVPTMAMAQRTLSNDSTALNPVVVTANRIATPLSSVTQAVTVLRGEDLRMRGITTVALALREVPGATVVQTGSYGGQTSFFLRGGESRYTKVLIDGVPVNSEDGFFSFEHLSTDNIDRIEVVRGPASALYGADAVTGVIQIFTRRGTPSTPMGLDASFRGGSYGSWRGDAAVRGGNSLATYSFSGGMDRTDGIYSFNNNYNNGTLTGALTLTPDAATTISVASHYGAAVSHYPTDFNAVATDTNSYRREHRFVVGLDAARMITPWLTMHVIGANNDVHGLSEDLTTTGTGSTATHTHTADPTDGYRRSGEVRAVMTYNPAATFIVGSQYEKQSAHVLNRTQVWTGPNMAAATTTESASPADTRTTRGYYGSMQGSLFSRLSYDAGVRYDDHDDFKNITTYHGGARVSVFDGTSVRASYGTSFNAPSFDATQGSAFNVANRSLQPEEGRAMEIALEQQAWNDRIHMSVGAFDQRFSQLIQYVFGTPSIYENLTQVRSKGYEGTFSVAPIDGLTADVSYNQTIAKIYKVSPTYTGSSTPGTALIRRPSHSGSANVSYARYGIGSMAATATYVGKRNDTDFSAFPSPTLDLPAYVKLDLSASVDLLHTAQNRIAITGRIENALDKKYEEILHYLTPGRAVFVGARFTTN